MHVLTDLGDDAFTVISQPPAPTLAWQWPARGNSSKH
jgi:hypothetical protein